MNLQPLPLIPAQPLLLSRWRMSSTRTMQVRIVAVLRGEGQNGQNTQQFFAGLSCVTSFSTARENHVSNYYTHTKRDKQEDLQRFATHPYS